MIENFSDINNNGIWDYGNIDNIKEFTIPSKGDVINFDDVYDWNHILNLLLLDKSIVKLGKYELSLDSPIETARLDGIIFFNLL